MDKKQRQKHQEEIELRLLNIEEIRKRFLNKVKVAQGKAQELRAEEIAQEVITNVSKAMNVTNYGNIKNQVIARQSTININNYSHPNKQALNAEKLKPYYEALNRKNYQSVVLGDPQRMTLESIYVEPYFSCHESCFGESYLEQATEWQPADNETEVKKHDFLTLPTLTSANDFLVKVIGQQPQEGKEMLKSPDKTRLFFLLGFPGQGKTSFCHRLFYDLSAGRQNDQPVFYLRLKDFAEPMQLVNNPRKAVFERLQDELEFCLGDNIFGKKDLNNCVLLLDGLDELAMVSRMDKGVTNDFCENLQHWIDSDFCENLKIVVTSRHQYLDFKKVNGENEATLVMQLLEFDYSQQQEWLQKFEHFYPGKFTKEDLAEYIRLDPGTRKPKYKTLYELLRLPILLYFIAQIDKDLTENATQSDIYAEVFKVVFQRPYARKKGKKPYYPSEEIKIAYRTFLREIAFAMFASGTGFVHQDEVPLPKGNREDQTYLHQLLANFYFREVDKQATPNGDVAIEFWHRSLQEYLCAEKVREGLLEFCQDTYRTEFWDDALKGQMFEKLSVLLAKGRLSKEIRDYLLELLAEQPLETRTLLADRFARLFPYLVEHDFVYVYHSWDKTLKHHPPIEQSQVFCYNFWLVLNHLMPDKVYKFDMSTQATVIKYLKKAKTTGLSLKYQNFEAFDLSTACLKSADLRHANLKHCNLHRATLDNALFQQADLIQVNLSRVDLDRANLEYANLTGTTLQASSANHSNFSHAILCKADLTGADLTYAKMDGANLEGAILERTNLGLTSLVQANLFDVNLTEANLTNATLNSAYMKGAGFSRATLLHAIMQTANLTKADLTDAGLEGADLQKAILEEADLTRARLNSAKLMGVDFTNTYLQQTNFEGADLTGAIFQNNDFTTSNLEHTTLAGAYFEEATFTQQQYDYAKAQGADLEEIKVVSHTGNIDHH